MMNLKLLLISFLTFNNFDSSVQFEFEYFFLDILDDVITKNVLNNKLKNECVEKLIKFNQSILVKDEWALKGFRFKLHNIYLLGFVIFLI